jgi:hypothetical protein
MDFEQANGKVSTLKIQFLSLNTIRVVAITMNMELNMVNGLMSYMMNTFYIHHFVKFVELIYLVNIKMDIELEIGQFNMDFTIKLREIVPLMKKRENKVS